MATFLTATVLYWSTAVDLLVILMMLFSTVRRDKWRQIYLGQFLGSIGLIVIALFLAYVLHFVPEPWLLSFLGLIPIYFGVKALFFDHDEDGKEDENSDSHEESEVEEARNLLIKHKDKPLTLTVALITFASCGADNIGLFTPYFITLTGSKLVMTLILFVIYIFLLIILGKWFAKLPPVARFMEKYAEKTVGIIYILIGIMVLVESGTISHFIG
ncbi:cadmium resistance transporter [Lactococcus insecticola]|uniref:Cadmium transporter n=1 Tax=Pseudolactococcus insecticola TaxID=2709158 RepID=A0A6A0B5U0_9LACT|nr:cadmium resistance transporter [Lactococcus insecticola]GFH40602.1 cadmium transporter [Lactococcus insecticola]